MKKQNILLIISTIVLISLTIQPVLIFAQSDDEAEDLSQNLEIIVPSVTPMPTATATLMPSATPMPTATAIELVSENVISLPVETATPMTALAVSSSEPSQTIVGTKANLSIFGNSFSAQTTVRLLGFGLLQVAFINPNALFVEVPSNVPSGTYDIEVSDPLSGTQFSPNRFLIFEAPTSTKMPPAPAPTSPPATPVPGEPLLTVSSYMPIPRTALQGEEITFNVTIINRGNRAALSPTAAFASGGSIIPSNSQTYVVLPSIGPNTSHTFSIRGRVSPTASRGLNSVAVSLSYSDFENKTYSSQSTLTAEIENTLKISELSLKNLIVNPDPIERGEPVILRLLLANTGTERITGLRLNLPPTGPIVLPGPEGNSFELDDIAPGSELAVTLNVIAAETLSEGLQQQPFQLSYVQDGAQQTTEMQAILPVAPAPAPMPATLLMESFSYGQTTIEPGDKFVFQAKIINLSDKPIQNALVTFSNQFGPNGGPSFFLFDSAGTSIVAEIPTGDEGIIVSQEFMSSGMLLPGINPLTFTVRYGLGMTDSFVASILVNAPASINFSSTEPIPSTMTLGETLDLSLSMYNASQVTTMFTSGKISAEKFDIDGDEDLQVTSIYASSSQSISASLTASELGDGKIVLDFVYLDYFGQEQTLTQEYSIEIIADATPTPVPEATEAVEEIEDELSQDAELALSETLDEAEEHNLPEDFWERILLAFLGLGY